MIALIDFCASDKPADKSFIFALFKNSSESTHDITQTKSHVLCSGKVGGFWSSSLIRFNFNKVSFF